MRARARRLVTLVVVVMVVLMVAGCSDDDAAGDAVLSDSAPAPTAGSSTTTATTTTLQASPSATEPVVDQAALQDAIAEVEGLGELEPAPLGCMASRLAADEGVLAALDRGLTFEALEPDLQQRVLLIAVECAPAAVAASVVDGIEAQLDDETRTCIVDRMAGDDAFLVALVQVALASRQADPATTAIPTAMTDDLVALMAACDVPLSALPE